MNEKGRSAGEGQVLVLAPAIGDEALGRTILEQAGLACRVCADVTCLSWELEEGADAVLLTQEALGGREPDRLVEALRRQPPWSDLPVLLLADREADPPPASTLEMLGNVTVLERQARVATLASALRAAVRARRRQYESRDQMDALVRAQDAPWARGEALRRVTDGPSAGACARDPEGAGAACRRAGRHRPPERPPLQVERLPLAYVLFDADNRVLDWNPAAERIFGYAREEVLGRVLLDLIVELPLNESLQGVLGRLRAGDMDAHSVNENRTRDGRVIVCEWFNTPLRDAEGRYAGTISLAQDVTLRKRAEDEMRDYSDRVQALSRRLMSAQEDERCRLARELHDEFGQVLATITLHLHAARSLAGEAARPRLEDCAALLRQAGEQVRGLALNLRPAMLETLGLESTLRSLAEQHRQRTGAEVQVVGHLSGEPLPPDLTIACFRVAQEALTNVVRHAQARNVWIELSQDDGGVELVVRDDGVGFEVGPTQQDAFRRGRLGLLGMAERTQLLGGALYVESEPGRGACIRAAFPTGEAPEEPAEPQE